MKCSVSKEDGAVGKGRREHRRPVRRLLRKKVMQAGLGLGVGTGDGERLEKC